MSRSTRLDPTDPIRSILRASGLTQTELGARMGLSVSAINNKLRQGAGIKYRWLLDALAAAGMEPDFRARKRTSDGNTRSK